MRAPLIRQGEGPAASIERIHRERQAERAKLDRLSRQSPDLDSHRTSKATAAGDSAKLRGIPVIGRGVTGATPGSQPDRIVGFTT
jgi:hypothetical protein